MCFCFSLGCLSTRFLCFPLPNMAGSHTSYKTYLLPMPSSLCSKYRPANQWTRRHNYSPNTCEILSRDGGMEGKMPHVCLLVDCYLMFMFKCVTTCFCPCNSSELSQDICNTGVRFHLYTLSSIISH